jgi:glycosyltransferase involved in cell wall biosynthesis
MNKLKILVYDTNFVNGLPRIIPLLKMKYWQEKGCEITILCTREGEAFYRSKLKNIHFITLDFTYKITEPFSLPLQYIKVNFIALKNIRKMIGKFDVVYSQSGIIDFLFVPWILKLCDKKILWFVMVDNIVPPPNKRPGPFLKKFIPYIAFKLGNLLLRKADGIFVVTNFLEKYFNNLGIKNVVKTNNGYGIQTEIFQGVIPNETPKVNALYCGRIHLAKGIMDLVEVINLVVKHKPNFKIGILGDGEESVKKEFYGKIKKAELENNFFHLGYQIGKRKGDILRMSDFYISLSYDESFGHSILEALACNKLVIAYDLPVYHEVFAKFIKKNQLILFPQKHFEAIANFIIQHEGNKDNFNNNLTDYTWDKIVTNELQAMIKKNNIESETS